MMNYRTLRKKSWEAFCMLTASAGGAGLLPGMPGTWGTVVTIPLVVWGYKTFDSLSFRIFVLLCLFTVCVASALVLPEVQKLWRQNDPSKFVLDEVAGFLSVPLITGKHTDLWVLITVGFALFRFFDIVKPAGIRRLDKMGGNFFGVMGDDVISGIYTGLILLILARVL